MKLITDDDRLSQYAHLGIFSSDNLIRMFNDSSGIRSKNTMAGNRFAKFARDYQIISKKSIGTDSSEYNGLTSAEVDLLFIEITKRRKSTGLNFDAFIEALMNISKRMFGAQQSSELSSEANNAASPHTTFNNLVRHLEERRKHLGLA
jgi:hypothetical protein